MGSVFPICFSLGCINLFESTGVGLSMHPSGVTYGKQNTGHLKLIQLAVNFSAEKPVVTTVFACLAVVQ